MWNIKGTAVAGNWLELTPETILYAYDGPRTFTCKDAVGNLYLAHWCDDDADRSRFLVVAFSETLLQELTTGGINVRDALSRPRAWIFDLDDEWDVVRCWRINVDDLPEGVLPKAGVMLWSNLPTRIKTTAARPGASETVIPTLYIGRAVKQLVYS
jgi:hypothetical protein